MQTLDSLKEIERRAYRSVFEDGLYDLAIGGLFLLAAWIPAVKAIGISRFYGYALLLLLPLIPLLGKRYITIPRLGAVEFKEKRKKPWRYAALIGVAMVVLMVPLVALLLMRGIPGGISWRMAALIAIPFIILGIMLLSYPRIYNPRMYLYALLMLYSIVVSEFLIPDLGLPLSALLAYGLTGAAIVMYGSILLIRFVKKYPKPASEAPHVS